MSLCDVYDLPTDQCAHCRPPVVEPETLPEATSRFAARFDSECDHCGGLMSEGDPICRTRGGDYVHDHCAQPWSGLGGDA